MYRIYVCVRSCVLMCHFAIRRWCVRCSYSIFALGTHGIVASIMNSMIVTATFTCLDANKWPFTSCLAGDDVHEDNEHSHAWVIILFHEPLNIQCHMVSCSAS